MEKSIRIIPKCLLIVIGLLMIVGLSPQTALAATHTVSDSQTFDISSCAAGDIVEVDAGATATLTGSQNVLISCSEGVTLTLDSVTSDVSATSNACALNFSGSGNTLILSGTNTFKSGSNEPGIQVETDTKLEIKGDGILDVTGGKYGAGIGGGFSTDGGTITISGGTVTVTGGDKGAGIGGGYCCYADSGTITISGGIVTATGGEGGAGIGGGDHGDGGTIAVSGGTVTVTGGDKGAGIGGGSSGDGGTITVSGGTVTATGGDSATGIGGGRNSDNGTITISGGTVTATGGYGGAGIGGGSSVYGNTITTITGGTVTATGGYGGAGIGGSSSLGGGTISITGGTVFAKRGSSGNKDIGPGNSSSSGSLSISGDALIFLANDACLTPNTITHTHFSKSGPLYGFSLPDGWTDAGIYARACVMTYDDNGGTGTKNANMPVNGTITVDDDSGFENPGYNFKEWNTKANGSGTSYAPGDNITVSKDITLYAIWTADKTSMIGSISPADYDAPIDGNVIITFNNDMDTSVTGTVSINGTALSGGAWSNSGRTYTIPYYGLDYYQSCTIDISGFQDSYGTTMTDDSASFTSESPADLSSLAVNTGSLNAVFDPGTAAYSVDASGIDSIGITAQTLDPGASMTINGSLTTSGTEASVDLDNGANMIPVVVTAQDGSQKSYIISVNGTVSDANLASLSLNTGSLSPAFDAGTTTYYANVGSDVDEIKLTASASDTKAVMLVDGIILSQGSSKTIPLSVGDNEIKLMVIAQDASTQTYSLTINRGDSDATLSSITLSEGTLSPAFAQTTTAYTATVENAVDSLTVTPTATDSGASITVNGDDASVPVDLTGGTNTITIVVTGSDGVTTRTYKIEVTRQDQITITNSSVPIGMVGVNYNESFEASGGTGAFTWSAAGLPSSLTLDSDGLLTGTPLESEVRSYAVTITAKDGNDVIGSRDYTLVIQTGCGNGAYLIASDGDAAYTGSYTDDGIPTLTVNEGVSGFTYFGVNISPVAGHSGKETCVYVLIRNGSQIAFCFNRADYDTVNYAGAGFNVKAGDVIEVYIVDNLSNNTTENPTVL
ncbi:cadherin-like beta sandwich domain-containing protein [Eubacteriaceae bacterium ES3]|nr:cadherin-like beta sandwich domain-containing protein [Eubacteriaceae bacterium ES3]